MPSGLIDGGVVEIETLEFGENDKTSTTQKFLSPFNWSDFQNQHRPSQVAGPVLRV